MKNLKDALKGYLKKDVLLFFVLGLACGVPLNLLGNTLAIWTNENNVNLKTIGLFALVMVPYSFKFLWAPFIDRIRLPFLSKIGAKKAWGIVFQIGLFFCIFNISFINPENQIGLLFWSCFIAAFFAASQDIVVDALRIDTLSGDNLKEGSATYQFGYRIGMLITGAGLIALSAYISWQVCYQIGAFLIVLGALAILALKEPSPKQLTKINLYTLIIAPFADFIRRNQKWFYLLLFIILYKICNAVLGKMAYPFYQKIGFSKNEIALISGTIGPWITMSGVFLGGLLMVRCGYFKSMMYLGLVEILTSLAYAFLAFVGPNVYAFFAVIVFDNIVGGMGGAVFVAFLSSLCSRNYSATQYALLTSFMMVATSFIASSSGYLASAMGWVSFFAMTGALMIPALVLLAWMMKDEKST